MPFQKGTSGNPAGRSKRYWITEKQRVSQARKSFKTLCEIRDGRIKEQEVDEKTGDVYDVAPSIKEVRESCKTIMAYAVGLPAQEVTHTGADGEPFAFNVILNSGNQNGNGIGHDAGAGGFSLHYGGGNGSGG